MTKEYITDERRLLHGGDYNPEQWKDYPEVLEQDIKLMKKSGVNTISVGMFSWTSMEPEEGVYDFEWLDQVFDRMNSIGESNLSYS